jgi:hypothetical protein
MNTLIGLFTFLALITLILAWTYPAKCPIQLPILFLIVIELARLMPTGK